MAKPKININQAGLKAVYAEGGEKMQSTINDVARSTADQPIEAAAATLQSRLAAVGSRCRCRRASKGWSRCGPGTPGT